MVLLYNFSDEDFIGTRGLPHLRLRIASGRITNPTRAVHPGDRIAQLILERIVIAPILEVDVRFPFEPIPNPR
jgi:dUTPase